MAWMASQSRLASSLLLLLLLFLLWKMPMFLCLLHPSLLNPPKEKLTTKKPIKKIKIKIEKPIKKPEMIKIQASMVLIYARNSVSEHQCLQPVLHLSILFVLVPGWGDGIRKLKL